MKNIKKYFVSLVVLGTLASCGGNASSFDTSKNINLYTRDTTSGTRDGFFTKIGLESAKARDDKNPDYSGDNRIKSSVVTVSSNADMLVKIQNDIYGLGYASLASVEEDTTGKIKGLEYEGVKASESTVLDGTYKLTRNFNYIIRSEYSDSKKGKLCSAFVAFMFSKDGKRIMKESDGILSVTGSSWSELSKEYEDVLNDESLSFEIKVGGSTSVQKMSQKLTSSFKEYVKSSNVKFTHNHGGSGDAYKYTQGSEKDSVSALDIAFLSRELKDSEKASEGTSGKMCVDAIVPIVNSENSYTSTTKNVLASMYSKDSKNDDGEEIGTVSTWEEVIK